MSYLPVDLIQNASEGHFNFLKTIPKFTIQLFLLPPKTTLTFQSNRTHPQVLQPM